jgi:holliday junction DNA helicase RuvA
VIGRLRGTLLERDDTVVVVDCGGVGYEVTLSAHTAAALPDPGSAVDLRIYTHVLENRIALYGFGSPAERLLFDALITVKNVGPSSAVGILSGGAGPAELARLIAAGNVAALTKIRGVGKKTAELVVVELRDKCEMLLLTWSASGEISLEQVAGGGAEPDRDARPARPPILDDVAGALAQLGWRPAEVEKVVAELAVAEDATIESLLRQALRSMPR